MVRPQTTCWCEGVKSDVAAQPERLRSDPKRTSGLPSLRRFLCRDSSERFQMKIWVSRHNAVPRPAARRPARVASDSGNTGDSRGMTGTSPPARAEVFSRQRGAVRRLPAGRQGPIHRVQRSTSARAVEHEPRFDVDVQLAPTLLEFLGIQAAARRRRLMQTCPMRSCAKMLRLAKRCCNRRQQLQHSCALVLVNRSRVGILTGIPLSRQRCKYSTVQQVGPSM